MVVGVTFFLTEGVEGVLAASFLVGVTFFFSTTGVLCSPSFFVGVAFGVVVGVTFFFSVGVVGVFGVVGCVAFFSIGVVGVLFSSFCLVGVAFFFSA